jgi:membrane-associated progesterone receptor component
MAKLSFEEEELSNIRLDDLTPGDRGVLDDWYNKFKYHRSYPIVGRISIPPIGLQLTKEQLSQFKGIQEVPKDRVNAPIYVSINRKILDVSYGGYEMYGVEGSYHLFAGIDASKALAKMSFDSQYLNNLDLSDLTPEELQVLADWDKRLCSKYPQVGILIDSPTT